MNIQRTFAAFFVVAGSILGGCAAESVDSFEQEEPEVDGERVRCMAEPNCAPDDRRVSSPLSCRPNENCYSATRCQKTIWCAGASTTPTCLAMPSCQPGDRRVTSSSQCRARGASCYDVELCGKAIRCQRRTPPVQPGPRPPVCMAYPSCDEGDREARNETECFRSGVTCYERTLCGKTIKCAVGR